MSKSNTKSAKSSLLILLFIALLSSCSRLDIGLDSNAGPYKSANDLRQYRHLTLDNNLDVLLISDPEADKAAASLDVYIGSYQNPVDRLGLAHFLEHMLFLGTAKYPDPGEYQAFISQHGGSHNAYTSLENTNYFFDIDAQYLDEALDRFATFFVSPNFDEAYVDRERNAVESEYRLKIRDDGRRQWDVLRELVNPQHPLSKFTVGNLETLADNTDSPDSSVRADLLAMYDQYYSANLMKLVVLGTEDLQQLESMVVAKFSAIKDQQTSVEPHGQAFFQSGQLPLQVQISPIKELRELSLMFELPKMTPHWQLKPSQYLAALIGHEETGSLLNILKEKGWAENLWAGASLEDRQSSLFTINISLTPEGLIQRNAVVEQVFAWIELIKQQGIERWRQQELARVGEINFRFLEKRNASQTVAKLSSAMQLYPKSEVLRQPYQISGFDPDLIEALLDRLIPDNMLIMLTAPDLPMDRQSAFYQVPYGISKPQAQTLDSWRSPKSNRSLALPRKNPFIPTELSLITPQDRSQKTPKMIVEQPGLRAWHFENTQFGVPRSNVLIQMGTDKLASVDQQTLAELYINLVGDQLNSELYAATIAGLSYRLNVDQRGIAISLGGYSQNQGLLLDSILKVLLNPDWSPARFERVRQQLYRAKLNAADDYPFRQIIARLYAALQGRSLPAEQALVLENLNLSELQHYAKQLLKSLDMDVLISGNLDTASANQILSLLNQLPAAEVDYPFQVAKLSEAELSQAQEINHRDAVVVQYIQGDADTLEERAVTSMIAQMLSAPFFNTLRTEKQLGYVVSAFPLHISRVPGIAMLVQSPTASESELRLEFVSFLQQFRDQLEEMAPQQLSRHKQALLTNIEEVPKNLSEMNGRFSESLRLGYRDFQFRQQLSAEIQSLTLDEIKHAYQRLIVEKPRQLWVQTLNDANVDNLKEGSAPLGQVYRYPF
ncbi:MAG: insulinase family protein [Porticoccaceae bacterium]